MTSLDSLNNKPVSLIHGSENQPEKVVIYTRTRPFPTGSGAQVRVYTNVRAYCDLGYDVEVVKFNDEVEQILTEIPDLPVKVSTVLIRPVQPSIWTRLAFILGFPAAAVLDYLYPIRKQVLDEVLIREKRNPGAIHHFEYLDLACSVVGCDQLRSVWSHHDFDSHRFSRMQDMRRDKLGAKSTMRQSHQLNRIRLAERVTSKNCGLILTIAEHETLALRQAYGGNNYHLLPMSWPEENIAERGRLWIADGKLRLFHLGSLNSMVPYSSMKFILEEVFPKIPQSHLDKLEFWVVGEISNGEYCQEIVKLAKRFPQVKLLGYLDEIGSIFGLVDLQLVGSTFASGLRTRMIESFARGLPVLSTVTAAQGILGLSSGENVLLTNDPREFAREILNLIDQPEKLAEIGYKSRQTYEKYYSRNNQAMILGDLIRKHLS